MRGQVFSATFASGGLTLLRRAVMACAAEEGWAGRGLEDFVVVVNEIVTNAVRHGGGGGRLRLWRWHGRLWCEVADDGPGLPPGWSTATPPPVGSEAGGRGLWLARRLCDQLMIVSGPAGTTVTFAARPRSP
ncbi:ATP-binding protein [Nonomuraea sp. MCN248]|uniref:ATP-binding protein n=1 Tax=Nonomuraea corallina TaxID=2989783 RepID=A0ABT4SGL6_9ACTN|nr:ATP-binding protein [Nonomuraea corallina]MDA0636289.1 ATP-binding protein [Nonomuraea corallina]